MTSYGLDEWFWAMFEPTWTWKVDLISLLVNFSCELGQIMSRYDFLWARWVILSNVWNRLKLYLISLLVNFSCEFGQIMKRLKLYLISLLDNFSCEFGQIMTIYDFLLASRVILSNVRTNSNFDFCQLFIWIGANRWICWEKNSKVGLRI